MPETTTCPDFDPDTEVCLDPSLAVPDPDPVTHTEQVKASTLLVGSGATQAVNKRPGWAVGLWRYDTGTEEFFQCTGLDGSGNPRFNDPGVSDRPDLVYRADQPRAHGILRERGDLLSVTLRVELEGKEVVSYQRLGSEINAEREFVLRRVENGRFGAPAARACPATRAVWIDEPHDPGAVVFATYTVQPLPVIAPGGPDDATDAIQTILNNNKSVVLPPGTYYVRTHYTEPTDPGEEPPPHRVTTGIEIPEGLYIRGREPGPGEDDRDVLDGGAVLRAIPALHSLATEPPLTLGIMITGSEESNTVAQEGAELKWLTVYGALDGIDLIALRGQPERSHHGVQFSGVNDVLCRGVRFTRCLDDGLKFDRLKYKRPWDDQQLVVSPDGRTFSVPSTPSDPNDGPPILEGVVKIDRDPNDSPPEFTITIPAEAPFGNNSNPSDLEADLTLYAANATRPRAGLAPIGFFTRMPPIRDVNFDRFGPPLHDYIDYSGAQPDAEPAYDAAIGWLDVLSETGYFCDKWRLPTSDDLPEGTSVRVDYAASRIVSNRDPSVLHCDLDRNGRNGYTHANHVGTATVRDLRVRGNGRLDAAIGLAGSLAADLQLGTTSRNDLEEWETIAAEDIVLEGATSSRFKAGAEAGPEYPVGPATYRNLSVRSCLGRGLRTVGRECGPLTFEGVEVTDCAEVAMSVGHGSGTLATELRFGNRKASNPTPPPPGDPCMPDFDPASLPDLSVSSNAYAPSKYHDPALAVRNEFRDIRGTLPDQRAYVLIQAPGVIVRGATNVHFEVRTSGSAPLPPCPEEELPDPPGVELYGPFVNCSFDVEPGTFVEGGSPCPPNGSEA